MEHSPQSYIVLENFCLEKYLAFFTDFSIVKIKD